MPLLHVVNSTFGVVVHAHVASLESFKPWFEKKVEEATT